MATKALPCVLLFLAASLAGCASTRDQSAADNTAGTSSSLPADSSGGVELSTAGSLPPGVQSAVVHFAFDSDAINAEGQRTVEGWARYLSANQTVTVRLEGHADERGTPEYNQGLGERRAIAVRRALMNLGVLESQLSTVSYGEIRPLADGHDEAAWSQNRRVEFAR